MLTVRELGKTYPGGIAALKLVDLDVDNGMFGLLGPNGAGKSTLMKILAGVLEPSSGTVQLDGTDIAIDPTFVRARLGYLPQDFGLNPELTGEQMLRYLLELKGVSAPKGVKHLTHELLARVNLTEARSRKIGTYSGGMKQRVGIAQAIAGDPRIVIVDEPTVGLDPTERHRLYALLADLATDRIVILSTHLVEDIAIQCPRFALIRRGSVVADTSPDAALQQLQDRCFEGAVDRERLEALDTQHRVTRSFLVAGQHRVRLFVDEGEPPTGFTPARPTLEDAYHVLLNPRGSETAPL